MEIKADVISIEKLKDYFFVVPDYQREYVWLADNHVSRFLQDINDEFNPNVGIKHQSNYFIGSTIIVKRDDGAFDVVDGQQRLTTIVITLCAIRVTLQNLNVEDEELKTEAEELLKVIRELLYKYNISTRKNTPRLILQYSESKDYLDKLITEKDFIEVPTPSITKMEKAYSTILDFLNELKTSGEMILINFISYFLANVEMVVIKPDNLGSALKIFETINERGVGLNAMDLLKNLLFIHANENDFAEIKQIWKEMLENINKSGEGDKPLRFLRYFLMARYHNGIIREDEIYKWMISEEGKTNVKYKSKPVSFSKELRAAAVKYSSFVKATKAWDADSVYPNITGIGYLTKKTSRQHLVLLMSLKDNIDKSIVNLLAKNIESLVFYYSANRTLTKSYEEKFAKWATVLRSISTIDELSEFLQDDFKKEFDDQQLKFNSQFATKSQGDLNPQYRVKYILGKLEDYIRTKVNFSSANYSFYQGLQLEHILPQTGENIPKDKYPQPYDYSNTVYMFGNLTLLEAPINQSLNFSNDISTSQWFDVKKEAYLNSTILLTRTFSEIKIGEQTVFNSFANAKLKSFNEWDMQTVGERQEILRKIIIEIWKLEMVVDISQEEKYPAKSTSEKRSENGESKVRSAWASLSEQEKFIVAEKIRAAKQVTPSIKDSELQTQFSIPSASTIGHILTYNQLKPSIEDVGYVFKGIPNDFFPADAPLPFEENYKGDCNFSNDKDGNYIKGSVGTGKYSKFVSRPAIIQTALIHAKLTNTICDFKSLNKVPNEE